MNTSISGLFLDLVLFLEHEQEHIWTVFRSCTVFEHEQEHSCVVFRSCTVFYKEQRHICTVASSYCISISV